jgi:benzaldehyde dehydrogenase (NAD)
MELLGTVDWSGRIFSGGWVEGGGQTYPAVEPATGRTLGQVGAASAADVDRAVGLARRAQPLWAAMSYQARAAVLRRAADLLEAHHTEIEDWSMREAGVPR